VNRADRAGRNQRPRMDPQRTGRQKDPPGGACGPRLERAGRRGQCTSLGPGLVPLWLAPRNFKRPRRMSLDRNEAPPSVDRRQSSRCQTGAVPATARRAPGFLVLPRAPIPPVRV